jgi:hypothetical protein
MDLIIDDENNLTLVRNALKKCKSIIKFNKFP